MSHADPREYYDQFSAGYDTGRDRGYHRLIDDLEIEFIRRFAAGKSVLEAGCGTGLLLERMRGFAANPRGFDLSPGMLEKARARGLDVVEGDVLHIPFAAGVFDVVYCMKVLAHVPDVRAAIAEMARVTRPGGMLILEFYNRASWRGLLFRRKRAGRTSAAYDEHAIYTRYDGLSDIPVWLPAGARIEALRGVRILTPAAFLHRVPLLGGALRWLERAVCDTWLRRWGGFLLVAVRLP